MAKEKAKKVVVELLRGVRINGQAIHPNKDELDDKGKVKKKGEPKYLQVDERFAMQLQAASKARICTGGEKANTELPSTKDEDDLDDLAPKK